jgi:hypothetical protein
VAQSALARRAMRDVACSMDLTGSSIHINYEVTAEGAIESMALHFGPATSDADIAAHVDRIVAIRDASSFLSRARAAISGMEEAPAGTVAGDAAHEAAKVPDMIQDRLRQLAGDLSPAERDVLESEIAVLRSNYEHFSGIAASGDLSAGTGTIARVDAPTPEFPPAPPGYYYREGGEHGWDLRRRPGREGEVLPPREDLTVRQLTQEEIDALPPGSTVRYGTGPRPDVTETLRFDSDTLPADAFAELTGPESTSSFKQYWEMLRDNDLATEAEVLAAIGNPAGRTHDSVRHSLKEAFESRVLERAAETADGVARTEAESLVELQRLTADLNSSDRGNILERWYTSRRSGLVAHPSMTDADNPGLVVGRNARGERTPDFVEGSTLVEMKSTRAGLNAEDRAQIRDGLRVSAAGGTVRLPDDTTRVVDTMRLVFTDIRGARGSVEDLTGWIQGYPRFSFEVFDSSGVARTINNGSLPGYLAEFHVSSLRELLEAM